MIKNFLDKLLLKIFELLSIYIKKNNFITLKYKNLTFDFLNISSITNFRSNTFFLKEPETLNFIDKFKKKKVFWDIGANIGLYSIFAAKLKKCKVYSFEPSVFNLEVLTRNINKNRTQDRIIIIPICLSEKISQGFFNIPSEIYGSALSTFKKEKKIDKFFSYKSFSVNADYLIDNKFVEKPDYLKLDVDGNELEILIGFKKNISLVKNIILEMDYRDVKKIKKIKNFLKKNNFILESKDQSEMIKNSKFKKVFNEVWINKKLN